MMRSVSECKILASSGGYEIITPYMQSFVTELKSSIPASERAYNKDRKTWSVSAKHGQTVGALIAKCFGQWIEVPPIRSMDAVSKILQVLYIGQCKQREGGESSAFGWCQLPGQLLAGWNVIFPEKVLRAWFDPDFGNPERPADGTYYQTLGISASAKADEIKTAYRRLVRQWHPDVCKEADAAEVFMKIQRAFEILSNPKMKGRYDAGLKLEAMTEKKKAVKKTDALPYRAPLRCGMLLCDCTELGGRYTVQKIKGWEDIVNPEGKTLSTSWVMGENEPTMVWL